MGKTSQDPFNVYVSRVVWLTRNVFEVCFDRPTGFMFIPGQKIRLTSNDISREYTLVNKPDSPELIVCVRYVAEGRFTPRLAKAQRGDSFSMSPAAGYFTFQPSSRQAIFVATGTGIAPFLAFVRAGVRGFRLLHGVHSEVDLLYREEIEKAAEMYIPCLPESGKDKQVWNGRVTTYLEECLKPDGIYDFYLCGSSSMMRDAVRIIDRRFPGSKVFTEMFF